MRILLNRLNKCVFGVLVGVAVSGRADVQLPALFSDHAVLQRAEKVPVWGRAAPGEKVSVSVADVRAETEADASGKWRVQIDLHAAGKGPFEMVAQGKNRLVVEDVVVGEVWVCSGQSNMALSLESTTHGAEEVAASADPMLRVYDNDHWRVCTPAVSGSFTAAGYYFGKNLRKTLDAPVGLAIAMQPATAIELWISPEAMDTDPELKAGKERVMEAVAAYKRYGPAFLAWEKQYGREDRPFDHPDAFASPALKIDPADWKPIEMPGLFAPVGLPDSGAVWIRRQVTVPPALADKELYVQTGEIRHFATVYWNGVKVGANSLAGLPESCDCVVPASLVKSGEATIAIRIFSPLGGAGIHPGNMSFKAKDIPLAGQWLARAEFALPALDEKAKTACPVRPAQVAPTGMFFDYAVRSKIPYAIRGVIWYQGESNTERAWQYRTALPLMIRDWREHWGQGDFPFYICQLPNFNPHQKTPGESQWAELREAQTAALSLPHTAQAVLIDAGEEGDIHPKDKKTVGERLALIALADTYGKPVISSGPVFKSASVEGSTIRVHFTHADGGLVARQLPATYRPASKSEQTAPLVRNSPQSQLEGFAICGPDHQWKWAEAKIDAEDVIVSSASIPNPLAVRYAWADNPVCNLYNGAGLPAGPFRTDDFPVSTVNARY